MEASPIEIAGIPITRRWLIPRALRPKLYWPHPTMSAEEIRRYTQHVWDIFYGLKSIWVRSRFIKSLRARLAFVLISKIYRQMYADTGIVTDSARVSDPPSGLAGWQSRASGYLQLLRCRTSKYHRLSTARRSTWFCTIEHVHEVGRQMT